MNRRSFLATTGTGIIGIAGCTALKRTVLSEDTGEPSDDTNTSEGDSPSIGADEANSTDTPPEDREETDPETDGPKQTNETEPSGEENTTENTNDTDTETEAEAENENKTETPDGDPLDAIEIVEGQAVFEEATDPNYESDELYVEATIRNTAEHDLQNVRLDAYVYANDVPVGHEYIEYSVLEAGGGREPKIPFYVDDPAAVDRYKLERSAAQWA